MVGAHVVAEQLGDRALAVSTNAAYVHGMGSVLLVSGIAALLTALLAAALPPTPKAAGTLPEENPGMVSAQENARQ